jgi:hypothetical protein
MNLSLDLAGEVVTVSGSGRKTLRFRGRWVEFYVALLAKPGAMLRQSDLHRIGLWTVNTQQNVGKAVWQHCKNLERAGFPRLIEAAKKTGTWKISNEKVEIDAPAPVVLAAWLSQRIRGSDIAHNAGLMEDFLSWTQSAVSWMIKLQRGNAEEALDLAENAWSNAPGLLFRQVSALLIARAEQRLGYDPNSPDTSDLEEVMSSQGAIAEAFQDRIISIQAFDTASAALNQTIAELRGRAVRAEARGDIGGAGIILNAMAVLQRRAGLLADGASSLTRAIPLLLASGDVASLQAAVFNLGHCVGLLQFRKDGKLTNVPLELLKLDRNIRAELNVGGDTAQNEVLMALLMLRMGELDECEQLLGDIRDVINRTQNPYDEGSYHRIQGKLLYATAVRAGGLRKKTKDQVVSHLTRAERYFRNAGRHEAADTVRRELANLATGKRPEL